MEFTKEEEGLLDEKFSTEFDIMEKLDHLIHAKWDSDTLKAEIEGLMKSKDNLDRELYELDRHKHTEKNE